MRKIGSVLLVIFCSALLIAQQHAAHATPAKPAALMAGIGNLHHPSRPKMYKPSNSSTRACA